MSRENLIYIKKYTALSPGKRRLADKTPTYNLTLEFNEGETAAVA